MDNINKKRKILFVLVVLGLALLGGLGGSWLYNTWFYQISSLRDAAYRNLAALEGQSAPVIIRGAKQVVVEQDVRSAEVIDAAEKVIVGIFKKTTDNNYNLLNAQAVGVIITSDGWLAANWQSQGAVVKPTDYVVITKDKKIYNLDKLVFDDFSDLTFIHLKSVNSLPVAGFSSSLELKRGQAVFLVGWLKTVGAAILTENRRRDDLLSSDLPFKTLKLSVQPSNEAVMVDLSGRVAGWITKEHQVISVDYVINAINYLLTNKKITPTVLGVNYLNSEYYIKNKQPDGAVIVKDKKGVAIKPGSPAAAAGLKNGDIIYSVDDKELGYNLDLADVVSTYQVGQKASFKYWRGSEKKEAIITFVGL